MVCIVSLVHRIGMYSKRGTFQNVYLGPNLIIGAEACIFFRVLPLVLIQKGCLSETLDQELSQVLKLNALNQVLITIETGVHMHHMR